MISQKANSAQYGITGVSCAEPCYRTANWKLPSAIEDMVDLKAAAYC